MFLKIGVRHRSVAVSTSPAEPTFCFDEHAGCGKVPDELLCLGRRLRAALRRDWKHCRDHGLSIFAAGGFKPIMLCKTQASLSVIAGDCQKRRHTNLLLCCDEVSTRNEPPKGIADASRAAARSVIDTYRPVDATGASAVELSSSSAVKKRKKESASGQALIQKS